MSNKINTLLKGVRYFSTNNSSEGNIFKYHPVHKFNKLSSFEKVEHQNNIQLQQVNPLNKATTTSIPKSDLPTHNVRSTSSSYLVVDDA